MKRVMLVVLFFVLLCFGGTYAATKEDVLGAINQSYEVAGKQYRLPEKFAVKIRHFLDKKEFSSEQYSKLLSYIQRVVSLAQEAGTIDVNEMTKEEVKEGVKILYEASETVDIDLEKELKENNIKIPKGKDSSSKPKNTTPKEEKVIEVPSGENIVSGESSSGESVQEIIPIEIPEETEIEEPEDTYEFDELEAMFYSLLRKVIISLIITQFVLFLLILLMFRMKRHKIIKRVLITIFILLFICCLVAMISILLLRAKLKKLFWLYYFFR